MAAIIGAGVAGVATAARLRALGHPVRVVPIAPADGQDAIAPTVDTVQAQTYPIARPLFMYTNGEPTGVVGAYIGWIKGAEGQGVLRDKGYVPLKD